MNDAEKIQLKENRIRFLERQINSAYTNGDEEEYEKLKNNIEKVKTEVNNIKEKK